MNKIITISRQYGSGGRLIGEMVSKQLNIPFYDSKIIRETMKKTGFTENMIKSTEQRVTNSFLFNLAMGVDEAHNHMKIIEQAEHDVIQNLAKQGPCVIIGRSANFILSEKDTLNVFIYSDISNRITYATEHYNIDVANAKSIVKKNDHERKMYALNFYNQDWENKNNYDLLLNSGKLGIDTCVKLIINAIKKDGSTNEI